MTIPYGVVVLLIVMAMPGAPWLCWIECLFG